MKEDQLIIEWRANVLSELRYCRLNIDELKTELNDVKVNLSQVTQSMQISEKRADTHYNGCPMNRGNVEAIVDSRIAVWDSTQPEKNRKKWNEILTIITALIAIAAFILTIYNNQIAPSATIEKQYPEKINLMPPKEQNEITTILTN
jgi:hypothetical protein